MLRGDWRELDRQERVMFSSDDAVRRVRSSSGGAAGRAFVQSLRPDFEDIRRRVFGSVKAPFRSYADGVRWIERELAQLPRNALRHWGHWVYDGNKQRPRYDYRDTTSSLDRLAEFADGAEQPSGVLLLSIEVSAIVITLQLPEHLVVRSILTEVPVHEPYWRITQDDLAGGRRSQVEIVIPVLEDLTAGGTTRLFAQIRRHAREDADKRPSVADLLLLRLVAEVGPPPIGPGAGDYWRGLLRAWRRRGQRSIGWKALQMRWRRLSPTVRGRSTRPLRPVKQRAELATRDPSGDGRMPARSARPAPGPTTDRRAVQRTRQGRSTPLRSGASRRSRAT